MSTLAASPSPSAPASKRHSLNISIGPRPLQLVDGAGGPQTAPLAQGEGRGVWGFESKAMSPPMSASARFPATTKAQRRQSSISYIPPDSPSPFTRYSAGVGRSQSVRGSGLKGQRDSTSSLSSIGDGERVEREPLTLVEKHAELLHFIAQKESKCLELRSQLQIHEAELLQLKRKWERIVAKGANTTSAGPSSTTTASTSPPPQTHSPSVQSPDVNTMMLGGIKEVGRWMASLSNTPAPGQSPPKQSSRPKHRTAKSSESKKCKTSDDEADDEDEDATIHPKSRTPVPEDDLLGTSAPIGRSALRSNAQQAAAPSMPGLGSISVAAPWVGKKLEELSGLTPQQIRSSKRGSLQFLADGLSSVLSPTSSPSLSNDFAASSAQSPSTTSRARKRNSTPSVSSSNGNLSISSNGSIMSNGSTLSNASMLTTSSSTNSSLLDDDDDDFFGNLLGQKSAAAFQVMTPDSTGARVASNSTSARAAPDARTKDSAAPKKTPAIKEETVFEQDEEWNW
ncbi:hypothetical protein K523DRAFT_344094 [Schizophyllum commune Tattone D]|nr:hypothetical protein K523DRAFT_344094 [Schizophyllum commune Tattone D]